MADDWRWRPSPCGPLPVAHKDMNEETRVRQRYVDLIMRPEARQIARTRIAVMTELGGACPARLLEVETPMLQTCTAVRPRARSSPTQCLRHGTCSCVSRRSCSSSGAWSAASTRSSRSTATSATRGPTDAFAGVRDARNHEAYGTYDTAAVMIRELVQEVSRGAMGTHPGDAGRYRIRPVGEWTSLEMYPSLSGPGEQIVLRWLTTDDGRSSCSRSPRVGPGKCLGRATAAASWSRTVGTRGGRQAPRAGVHPRFPVETSPLVRSHRSVPGVVEKWEGCPRFRAGHRATPNSVDPVIQRERFVDRRAWRRPGTTRAMVLDEEFLAAMEYGMPPTAGTGMGIDCLLMAPDRPRYPRNDPVPPGQTLPDIPDRVPVTMMSANPVGVRGHHAVRGRTRAPRY